MIYLTEKQALSVFGEALVDDMKADLIEGRTALGLIEARTGRGAR